MSMSHTLSSPIKLLDDEGEIHYQRKAKIKK